MGKIKLQSFVIVCDRQPPVYRPGEIISGNCVINLKGELDLKQLDIKLYGCAKVEWTEREGNRNVTYYSKCPIIEEIYFPGSGDQKIFELY